MITVWKQDRVSRPPTAGLGTCDLRDVVNAPGVCHQLGRTLIDRRRYLPEHPWCAYPECRHAAGTPDEVQFQAKPGQD